MYCKYLNKMIVKPLNIIDKATGVFSAFAPQGMTKTSLKIISKTSEYVGNYAARQVTYYGQQVRYRNKIVHNERKYDTKWYTVGVIKGAYNESFRVTDINRIPFVISERSYIGGNNN